MKKILGCAIMLSVLLILVGCKQTGGEMPTPTPTYTVIFSIDGEISDKIAPQTIKEGLKVTEPTAPTKTATPTVYFAGWYTEDTFVNKWDFAVDRVNSMVTLYAKWEEFVDKTNTRAGIMKAITGGSFSMGSTNFSDEQPVRQVTVSSFYMGETEVTQKQWESVMGSTWPGTDPATYWANYGRGNDFPAYFISWYDAIAFCNKLSEKEGLGQVYSVKVDGVEVDWETITGVNTPDTINADWDAVTADFSKKGYRLPTEAEWEYAAGHGGFGDGGTPRMRTTYAGTSDVEQLYTYAWYSVNNNTEGYSNGTKQVGTKKPNVLRLKDMSGNVEEWCWDWYGGYESTDTDNPTGAESGSWRVCRGGGWINNAEDCQVTTRLFSNADYRGSVTGFRVARSL